LLANTLPALYNASKCMGGHTAAEEIHGPRRREENIASILVVRPRWASG
jgi:hypothetical protein